MSKVSLPLLRELPKTFEPLKNDLIKHTNRFYAGCNRERNHIEDMGEYFLVLKEFKDHINNFYSLVLDDLAKKVKEENPDSEEIKIKLPQLRVTIEFDQENNLVEIEDMSIFDFTKYKGGK